MLVKDLIGKSSKLSFELFPPKTPQDVKKLLDEVQKLLQFDPAWLSVTYGAGGSSKDHTLTLLKQIKQEFNVPLIAHLTCIGHSKDEIKTIIEEYDRCGIRNILALRGDNPAGGNIAQGDFDYAAELVDFIRCQHPEICIGVAGFPEGHHLSANRLLEMDRLKNKIDAGADFIITQLFFDNNDYFDYVQRCALIGIDVPIVPGIISVTSIKKLNRLAEMAPRCRFPAKLLQNLGFGNALPDDKSNENIRQKGVDWAASQIRGLLDGGVPLVHLYTLNRARDVLEIMSRCDLPKSSE